MQPSKFEMMPNNHQTNMKVNIEYQYIRMQRVIVWHHLELGRLRWFLSKIIYLHNNPTPLTLTPNL